ncbi:hypothetical protein B0A49_09810 [Cryomyces minteri]|uniref:Uncharacterized protein n=1 Tax=Cryomyces minteri TaxID=331657 RepID=A0A4U0WHA2_9PEZI|nr:hypothetical protein B0A49_09810 [Cryomyces minteri]
MQNCMVYPMVSRLITLNSLTEESKQTADEFGILGDAYFNSSQIALAINGCAEEYCASSNSPEYDCEYDNSFPLYWQFCTGLEARVNPDIGGVGVFLSYYMQTGIAIAAWVLQRLYDTWIRNIAFMFFLPMGPRRAWTRSKNLQARVKKSRQPAALSSGMVEFQKAQCFFMLAVQSAALTALWSKGHNFFAASSYQQLWNNVTLLGNVAVGGFLPVTFTLSCLHAAGIKSWYIFVLSACTLATSAITLFTTSRKSPSPDQIDTPAANLAKCGGLATPVKYCLDPFSTYGVADPLIDGIGGPIFLFCLAVLFLLFLDLCKVFHRKMCENRITCYEWLRIWCEDWKLWQTWEPLIKRKSSLFFIRWMHIDSAMRFSKTVTAVFVSTLEGLFLYWFVRFLRQLYGGGDAVDFTAWSFGQIVAVTVWAPALLEWLYLVVFGIEGASKYRIAKPYRVIKDDNDEIVISHAKIEGRDSTKLSLLSKNSSHAQIDHGTALLSPPISNTESV